MDPTLHTFGQECPKISPLIVTELVCSVFCRVAYCSHEIKSVRAAGVSSFFFCNGGFYFVMVAGRKEEKKVVFILEFRTNNTSFIHEKT